MNKLIHGSIKIKPDSKSTKDPSHHHNITRSLLTMDLCDGIVGKITNDLRHSSFCDDFDITFMKLWGNSIIYWEIFSILREQIYINKALLPDILPKFDFFSVFAVFQSKPTFLGLKTAKKHAFSTLKNQKSKQANQVRTILRGTTTRVLQPYTPSQMRTPSRCMLFSRTIETLVKSL